MSKRIGSHSVQQITENEQAEVRVDTRIRGSIQVKYNRPDIFIYDKKRRQIIIIEVCITSQDNLQSVESEKTMKYDVLANNQSMLYGNMS